MLRLFATLKALLAPAVKPTLAAATVFCGSVSYAYADAVMAPGEWWGAAAAALAAAGGAVGLRVERRPHGLGD